MAALLNLNVAPLFGAAFSSEKKILNAFVAIGLGLAHHLCHIQQIDSRACDMVLSF
jgi:hypothetical protein